MATASEKTHRVSVNKNAGWLELWNRLETRWRLVLITVFFLTLLFGVYTFQSVLHAEPQAANLVVEITVEPAIPALNEEVTIHLTVRNLGGTAAVGPITTYLYIDPADQPPNAGTPGRPFQTPSLAAGASFAASQTHTFTAEGCDHVIYAWVDRDGDIAESDESDNRIELPLCVGVECEPDTYEPDNQCSAATWLTENSPQDRTFCHDTDPNLADDDWIKFTAFSGLTYTLSSGNAGIHAAPLIQLYANCTAAPTTAAESVTFNVTTPGVFYARIAQDATVPPGPLTDYELDLSSQGGATDDYEPDNRCSLAREITTDGVRQQHRFQSPYDDDWVTFSVEAGESFIALTDNTATNVNPVISLFTDCNQVADNNSLAVSAAQVEDIATTARTYVARVRNQDPTVYGEEARYDLRVVTSDCQADAFEEDDSPDQANVVSVGGALQRHTACPANDADWSKVSLTKDDVYVFETANLAENADTVLELYDQDGTTLLAQNDDFNYTKASRIVFEAPANGNFFIRARHLNIAASGDETAFDFRVQEGVCKPDDFEGAGGDNGPADARSIGIDGTPLSYNICADALNIGLGDQDWTVFDMVPGGVYSIQTSELGVNSDTVLELFAANGATLLAGNDDAGEGRAAALEYTAQSAGNGYIRVTQFNSNVVGSGTDYALAVFGDVPTPTPTPIPPTPTPTPTVPPTPTPDPSTVETLILVSQERMNDLHGTAETTAMMNKLQTLAEHDSVNGAVIVVENNAGVASAYTDWTANQSSLTDNVKANNVASAIRSLVLSFLENSPNAAHIVIVGDDRAIPFRRVKDQVQPAASQGAGSSGGVIEADYAPDVSSNSTVAAALAANMVLTDDYYADRQPSLWQDRQNNSYELYLPDYAISRLIETPDEIEAVIDQFLADQTIETSSVLVTGYDFIQDSAGKIDTLFRADTITTDSVLISSSWSGDALRTKQLQGTQRYDIHSLNGHATHVSAGTPDEDDITAADIAAATSDLVGVLIYNVGCHAGLNDPDLLDLPQAYVQQGAYYVGNTGYGWGGSGVVYSEALMRNYSRELLRETTSSIGPALSAAKLKYAGSVPKVNAFDAKVMMQAVLYGLPMVEVTSGGALNPDDLFPSLQQTVAPPSAFGPISQGTFAYGLPESFGAFGQTDTGDGMILDLDGSVNFSDGAPIQPGYFADIAAPAVGSLRGVLFRGGVYQDSTSPYDPVVAVAFNEYSANTAEPSFTAPGWTPSLPFQAVPSASPGDGPETVVVSLGQFNADPGTGQPTERVFDQMTFDTLYSDSADFSPPELLFVDGIRNARTGKGTFKVEAVDGSGIHQIIVAYTHGDGQWKSLELTLDEDAQKWTGEIDATANTQYFVQIVDNAANVTADDNKGRYYQMSTPQPLASGNGLGKAYLPTVNGP